MFIGYIGVYVFCQYVPVCLCSITLLGTWPLFYVEILGIFLSYLVLLVITLTAELHPRQEGKGSMFAYLCFISRLCVSLFGRNGLCLWRAHVSVFVVDIRIRV